MSLPGFPSVIPFILSQGEQGGGFNICLYLALPLSLHSSYGKVRRGLVLTYVSTWLSRCHSIYLIARCAGGWFKHMSLPGFAFVVPFILSQGEQGGGFNICLYLALPLSLHSSYRKVKKGGVF